MASKKLVLPSGDEIPLDCKRDPDDIELATKSRSHIENYQCRDKLNRKEEFENLQLEKILARDPTVRKRSGATPVYNCHGLSFACRRTRITSNKVVDAILLQDEYDEVREQAALPGDLVLYYGEDGDIEHSGIVVESWKPPISRPIIISKWGSGPEFIHRVSTCGTYDASNVKYFRSKP